MAKKKKKKAAEAVRPGEEGTQAGSGVPAEAPVRTPWLRIGSVILGIVLALFGFLMILEFFAGNTSNVDYTAFSNFYAVVILIVLPLALGAYLITNGIRTVVMKPPPFESVFTAIAVLVIIAAAALTLFISFRNISQGQRIAVDVILIVISLAALVWAAFIARGLFRKA